MTRAFVFPGQGSQTVGMGQALAADFPAARAVFDEVDDALGQKLSALMFDGPQEDLTLTENAQPALMAVSVAVVRVLMEKTGRDLAELCRYVAGHSLGEYSALCAAGALSLADTARLLKRRGQAMQRAVPVGEGTMAALLGLDFETATGVAADAAQGQVCDIANDNATGQVVVSGHVDAVARAIDLARERGARKPMLLPVSAPFHCAMMAPAADVMREALAEVDMSPPVVPVVANVSARPVTEPAEIRDLLVRQVTSMVRWRESVLFMKDDGIGELVEVGAGKILATMTKRIDRGLPARSVGDAAAVTELLESL